MRTKLFSTMFCMIFVISTESVINAQIHDIKKNSRENNNNSSNRESSNSYSSGSDDDSDNSGCLDIFSLIPDLFGCLSSLPEKSGDDNNYSYNNNYNNTYNQNEDSTYKLEEKLRQDNLERMRDTIAVAENQKIKTDESITNVNDTTISAKTPEISLDINANIAFGFEYSKEKTYSYYNFLPGLRVNLSNFLIDFRYNMLAEFSDNLPDAFKTWDLVFLSSIKADEKTKIILGTGMHKEEFTNTLYNQHYLGFKTVLNEKQDFLDVNLRITIDYKTSEFPFNELGIHYNKRFINFKKLSGYFSIGAIYQNYYSSTDIWALEAGVKFNWH